MQLVRRKTFLAGGHQVRGHDPFRQRDMRTLHDGADRDGKGLAAVLALVDAWAGARARQLGNPLAHDATARANGAVRPKDGFQMLASRVVIVVDRVAKIGAGLGGHRDRLSTLRRSYIMECGTST